MESSELRRRDTTKGTPLRILSLDGGGVRGYSMLILLNNFMHRAATECAGGEAPPKDNSPKPCDYFDLIAGTGTGGLIAIMLGRLRMTVEDCMRIYTEMTKRVFETDKTIAGIPYRSTLFKASKLEDAIRDCVREYDKSDLPDSYPPSPLDMPMSPARPDSMYSSRTGRARSSMVSSVPSRYSTAFPFSRSNPNAPLYDSRPNRTKTAVTAVLKGNRDGSPTFLRSYESPSQPSIEPDCTIWQAGRATCATGLAFKPIQIGKSIFLDEGKGKYNPAPQVLEEAVKNEWPRRSVGVFLSIGTGKRPEGTSNMQREWWEGYAGGIGDFAEARRRLISKIEGCETTHQEMLGTSLGKKYLNSGNYFRLNVDIGVGEFGMNEWNQLAEISNRTNDYLAGEAVKKTIRNGAIEMAKVDMLRRPQAYHPMEEDEIYDRVTSTIPPPDPNAVELPGEEIGSLYPRPLSTPGPQYPGGPPYSYQQRFNSQDKFSVIPSDEAPHMADHPALRTPEKSLYRRSNEHYRGERPESSDGSLLPSPQKSMEGYAPPLPPKTPIPFSETSPSQRYTAYPGRNGNAVLPYPDDDEPPPMVNMARKPEYVRR